ncbi:dentin sialophosphoprotein [Eurosta solidaginis]|uniref:dentin sialophosphoprotein n=1 Tax=Eurosta solidaginis TaxID=178769 RepID=UPI003530638B
MTTLHVCFADLSQHGNEADAAANHHELHNAMNETGALSALNGVNADADSAANSVTTSLTLQTDLNKGNTPPCKHSPGASSAHSISATPRYERNMSFFQQLSRRFGLLRSNGDPIFNATANDDDSTDSCSSMQHSIDASNTSSLYAPNIDKIESNNNVGHLQSKANMKEGHGSSSEQLSYASSDTSSTIDIDETHEQQQQQSRTYSLTVTDKTAINNERRSSARSSFSRLQRRSTSSLRRAFEKFSLSSRSLSCGGNTSPPLLSTQTSSMQHTQRMGVAGNTPNKSSLKYSSNNELSRKSLGSASICASTMSSKSSKSKTKPPPQRILRQPVSYTYLKGISGLPTQRVPRSAVCCQYARR